jgi:hypothetical protein
MYINTWHRNTHSYVVHIRHPLHKKKYDFHKIIIKTIYRLIMIKNYVFNNFFHKKHRFKRKYI